MAIRLVQTDLGDRAAKHYGMEQAPVTLEECVSGIITQVIATIGGHYNYKTTNAITD